MIRTTTAASLLLLAAGPAVAQELSELEKAEQWIDAGVNSAFLTEEQAGIMRQALRVAASGTTTVFDVQSGGGAGVIRLVRSSGDGSELAVDREFEAGEFADALAFAEAQIAADVAAGRLDPEAADALLNDIRQSITAAAEPGDGSTIEIRRFISVGEPAAAGQTGSSETRSFTLPRVDGETGDP